MVNRQGSFVATVAILTLTGAVGGMLGLFLLLFGVGCMGGMESLTECLQISAWGVLFGAPPGLLLGLLHRTRWVRTWLSETIPYLSIISFMVGLVVSPLTVMVILANCRF